MDKIIYGNAKQYDSNFNKQIIDLKSIEQINICMNKIKENNQATYIKVHILFYFNLLCFILGVVLFYNNSYVLKALGAIPFMFFLFNLISFIFMCYELDSQLDDKKSFYTKSTDKIVWQIEKIEKFLLYVQRKKIKHNEDYINTFLSAPINQAKLVLPLCDLYYKNFDNLTQYALPHNLLDSLENKQYINFCKYYTNVDKFIHDINNRENNVPYMAHNYYTYLKKYEDSYYLNKKLELKLTENKTAINKKINKI